MWVRETVYPQEKIQQIKMRFTCNCRHLHLLSRSLLRVFVVVVAARRHLGGRSSDRGAVSGVRVREGLIKTEKGHNLRSHHKHRHMEEEKDFKNEI